MTSDGQKTKKKIFPGQYKTHPNHVITEEGSIFKFAKPLDVPIKMQKLMDWFHKEMEHPTLSIASFIAQLHHRFIVIHPFDDGNGRITRLWINYVLLRFGYPPLVIKSEDKRNYFAALQRADNIDIDSLAVYLGKALISWLEIGIKAAKGEDISETGDVDKEVDLFIREQKSKGLNKYFSKESAINLIDNLSEVLFETFKNKFKKIDELFDSTEIKQTIVRPNEKFLDFINKHKYEIDQIPKDVMDNYIEEGNTVIEEVFIDKEDIKKQLELLEYPPISFETVENISSSKSSYIRIYIDFLYNAYRGQYIKNLERPPSMSANLLVEMSEFQYNISIISSTICYAVGREERKVIDIERYYNQLLTQKEVDVFIEQGQKEFLKLLKSATGKSIDDKK